MKDDNYNLRLTVLSILKEFINACLGNEFQNYLDGGSAIDAIRHKGFIP